MTDKAENIVMQTAPRVEDAVHGCVKCGYDTLFRVEDGLQCPECGRIHYKFLHAFELNEKGKPIVARSPQSRKRK